MKTEYYFDETNNDNPVEYESVDYVAVNTEDIVETPPNQRNIVDKIKIAKTITSLIVGAGVTKIVGGIIANSTNKETLIAKVTVTAASLVIGAMVSDITSRYTNDKIDELLIGYDEAMQWYNTKISGNLA